MTTLIFDGLSAETPLCCNLLDNKILRWKSSRYSDMLSLIIGTSNETLVTPARNVTVYGPEP